MKHLEIFSGCNNILDNFQTTLDDRHLLWDTKQIWKPVLFLLTKPLKQIRGCGCLNATFNNNLVIPSFTRLIVMTVLASVCFLTISSDEKLSNQICIDWFIQILPRMVV